MECVSLYLGPFSRRWRVLSASVCVCLYADTKKERVGEKDAECPRNADKCAFSGRVPTSVCVCVWSNLLLFFDQSLLWLRWTSFLLPVCGTWLSTVTSDLTEIGNDPSMSNFESLGETVSFFKAWVPDGGNAVFLKYIYIYFSSCWMKFSSTFWSGTGFRLRMFNCKISSDLILTLHCSHFELILARFNNFSGRFNNFSGSVHKDYEFRRSHVMKRKFSLCSG